MKAEYEERCQNYDPLFYWEHVHPHSTLVLSAKPCPPKNVPAAKEEKKSESALLGRKQVEEERLAKLKRKRSDDEQTKQEPASSVEPEPMDIDQTISTPHNMYEGDTMAKQLGESLDHFLNRLRPSQTGVKSGPWIWIANPHASNKHIYRNQPRFVDEGSNLLNVYMTRKRRLEEQNPSSVPGTITRNLKLEREWLEDSLSALAQTCSVTNGKWMLFPMPDDVDRVWAIVAKGTLEGRLGSAAKVATADADDGKPERLICVYTDDFTDVKDVKRVLKEMRKLNVVSTQQGAKWIYYKIDAYTYLGINSDNEYKLKASKYCSKDMLPEIDFELM
jgi:Domain of unknown function (DUF1917)